MNFCLHLGRKAVLSVKNPQHKMEWKGNYSTINTNKYKTRSSAIAERPRCRVHYSFRQK